MKETHKRSAGVILYRRRGKVVEVLLLHMGGPFWMRKDEGAWTIPKGEYDPAVEPGEVAAQREFLEETGHVCPGSLVYLGEVQQGRGKVAEVWMAEGDLDADAIRSNTFEMEWPKGSGHVQQFPEVDRAEWCDLNTAEKKLCGSLRPVVKMVAEKLGARRE